MEASTVNLKTTTPRRRTDRSRPKLTLTSLVQMSQRQLDDLFASSPAGATPAGVAEGRGIVAPGTPVGAGLQPLLRLAWRGKAGPTTKSAVPQMFIIAFPDARNVSATRQENANRETPPGPAW